MLMGDFNFVEDALDRNGKLSDNIGQLQRFHKLSLFDRFRYVEKN